jgi:hypothetical protein
LSHSQEMNCCCCLYVKSKLDWYVNMYVKILYMMVCKFIYYKDYTYSLTFPIQTISSPLILSLFQNTFSQYQIQSDNQTTLSLLHKQSWWCWSPFRQPGTDLINSKDEQVWIHVKWRWKWVNERKEEGESTRQSNKWKMIKRKSVSLMLFSFTCCEFETFPSFPPSRCNPAVFLSFGLFGLVWFGWLTSVSQQVAIPVIVCWVYNMKFSLHKESLYWIWIDSLGGSKIQTVRFMRRLVPESFLSLGVYGFIIVG